MSESNSQYVDRAGVYRCTVEKPVLGWFGEAGEKETPFIRIPCRVQEQRDSKTDQVGRTMTFQGWLTDGAFDRTVKSLCEAFPSWDGSLDALANGSFGFEGLECEIVANTEEYNGETRVKAQWLNPIGGGGKPLEKEKVESLLRKLGRKSMAIAKTVREDNGGAPPAPAPRHNFPARPLPAGVPAQGEPEDDDIPF